MNGTGSLRSHPSIPAIPRPAYKARDGKTSALKRMQVGASRDFDPADANRVRVMACRLVPKNFRTRRIGDVLRVWRTA
jgi:hypothetical protein